jgi:hypothetical protein
MSKLTWGKESRVWLFDGKLRARKKFQRGRDPVRRKRRELRMTSRAIIRELDQQEREQVRRQWQNFNPSYTTAQLDLLVFLATCDERVSLRFFKNYLKNPPCGKCNVFYSHSWKGGNGRCNNCGALTPASQRRVLRAVPPKTVRLLGVSRKELRKLVKQSPENVLRMMKSAKRRAIRERRWEEQRARILKELNINQNS